MCTRHLVIETPAGSSWRRKTQHVMFKLLVLNGQQTKTERHSNFIKKNEKIVKSSLLRGLNLRTFGIFGQSMTSVNESIVLIVRIDRLSRDEWKDVLIVWRQYFPARQ